MPRATDSSTTPAMSPAETGLAALEAKVEEIQVEVAEEAQVVSLDAPPEPAESTADAAPFTPEEPVILAATQPSGMEPPAMPLLAMLSAFGACAQATAQFQIETVAGFAGVRGPADLFRVQSEYGERLLALLTGNFDRLQPMAAFGDRARGVH